MEDVPHQDSAKKPCEGISNTTLLTRAILGSSHPTRYTVNMGMDPSKGPEAAALEEAKKRKAAADKGQETEAAHCTAQCTVGVGRMHEPAEHCQL